MVTVGNVTNEAMEKYIKSKQRIQGKKIVAAEVIVTSPCGVSGDNGPFIEHSNGLFINKYIY